MHILLIESASGEEYIFPKGGWQTGETAKQAAARETFEEAGLMGTIIGNLGSVSFASRKGNPCTLYGFCMRVQRQANEYDEKHRVRRWVTVDEALKLVQRPEMRTLLDRTLGLPELRQFANAYTPMWVHVLSIGAVLTATIAGAVWWYRRDSHSTNQDESSAPQSSASASPASSSSSSSSSSWYVYQFLLLCVSAAVVVLMLYIITGGKLRPSDRTAVWIVDRLCAVFVNFFFFLLSVLFVPCALV
jgi:ADP-ribose pyrophosphatase YjhB (NUDIX family)